MNKARNSLAPLSADRIKLFLSEAANLQLEPGAVRRFIKLFPDFDLWNERVFSALFTKPSSTGVVYPQVSPESVGEAHGKLAPGALANKYPWLPSWDPKRVFYVDDTKGEGGYDLLRRLVIPYFRAVFRATWIEPDAKVRNWAWLMFRAELARIWEADSEYLHLWLWDSKFMWLGEPHRDTAIRLPEPPKETPIEEAFWYLLTHHRLAKLCQSAECPAPYFFASRHTQRYCSDSCSHTVDRDTKRRWWAEHGPSWRKARSVERRKGTTKTKSATKKKLVKGTNSINQKKGK